jgi:hypothetical protein
MTMLLKLLRLYSVTSKGKIVLKRMGSNNVLERHGYVPFAGIKVTLGWRSSGNHNKS